MAGQGRLLMFRDFWHGTLLQDKADASGLNHRRNRYYDPATGRFTQEDPIGLAGGINSYGFAEGDPVSYSDPFGLCKTLPDETVDPECAERARQAAELAGEVERRVRQWNAAVRNSNRDHSTTGHQYKMNSDRQTLRRVLNALLECDDDDFRGSRQAAERALAIPVMQGPGRYPRKADVPLPDSETAERAGWLATAGVVTYWIISEASRLFPPRNLIPIP